MRLKKRSSETAMAKKSKKDKSGIVASNEFTTLEVDDELKPIDNVKKELDDADLVDELIDECESKDTTNRKEVVSEFLPRLTNEMKDKLDQFDAIEKHCVELEEANAKLTDSVSTYLEELEVLKSKKAAEVTIDGTSHEDLKKELDTIKHENAEMRKTISDLREENDNHLLRISELSFENAKMTSQLQELEKQATMIACPSHNGTAVKHLKPSTATILNQRKFANPYLQNGYESW